MANYQTELRNKNRGYMKLIVWQKAMQLFEMIWQIVYVEAAIDFKLRAQLAETLTRSIGLKQTKQIADARFEELDRVHYEVENRLLRLIEKLEHKRDDEDWVA